MEIVKVIVYLDDNVPEYMNGILRIANVIVRYKNGKEISMPNFVDNTEYYSEREIIGYISNRIGVLDDIVEINY